MRTLGRSPAPVVFRRLPLPVARSIAADLAVEVSTSSPHPVGVLGQRALVSGLRSRVPDISPEEASAVSAAVLGTANLLSVPEWRALGDRRPACPEPSITHLEQALVLHLHASPDSEVARASRMFDDAHARYFSHPRFRRWVPRDANARSFVQASRGVEDAAVRFIEALGPD